MKEYKFEGKVAKYKFRTREQFLDKFEDLHTKDEEGNLITNFDFSIVQLGHVILKEAEFDNEKQTQITEAEYSEEYLVDAIWYLKDTFNENGELEEKDHPYGWKTYSVDSKIKEGEGIHSFAGINYQENKF